MARGNYAEEIEGAIAAARRAGRAIKRFYDDASATTYAKSDGSAVTDADLASDRIIRDLLADRFPKDAVLTEEGTDDQARLAAERCWIVDPLDGTDQFVNRTGEFDVLIALVVANRPVVAVAYQPTTDLLFAAVAGGGAWAEQADGRFPVTFAPVVESTPPRVATSVWFGAPANIAALTRIANRVGANPPLTLTTNVQPRALVAPDRAYDVCVGLNADPDHAMAWEWDFVALDLIVHEAGGRFTDLRGQAHRYNKPHLRNRGGLLAASDPSTHQRLVDAIHPELSRGNRTSTGGR